MTSLGDIFVNKWDSNYIFLVIEKKEKIELFPQMYLCYMLTSVTSRYLTISELDIRKYYTKLELLSYV